MINNEFNKGEEDEQAFSGSRIQHYWFADFIILVGWFLPLQSIYLYTFLYKQMGLPYNRVLLLFNIIITIVIYIIKLSAHMYVCLYQAKIL